MALDFVQFIAGSLSLPAHKVKNTLQLLEGGATVPFIARYRKEATGSLDETEIHAIQKESKRIGDLEKRKEVILASIDEQGKMTPDLKKRIESCFNLTELEDIYLPYRPKRRTKATIAKEKGLEPLAQALFAQDRHDLNRLAQPFIGGEVADVEDALQGARDIIAEWVNEDEKARNRTRQVFSKEAVIRSKVARGKEEEGSKYRDYFDFSEPLAKCPSHRLLAIRRGEDEGFLRVVIEPDREGEGFAASRTEPDDPWAEWVRASVARTTGAAPAVIPQMGGSICNELFTDLLGLPAIWLPHSYAGCGQHAPDEHVLLPLCRSALEVMAGLWWDLGEPGTPG